MARLILHIGTHKTGTTFLQNTLTANARRLESLDIWVPQFGRAPGHHALAGAWNAHLCASGPADAAWTSLNRNWSQGPGTTVVSSEELSRLFGPAAVDFAQMRAFCAGFDEVRVICVLRNQASFLQSAYLQVARQRATPGWRKTLRNALEKERFNGLTLNYDRLCSRLLDGFARSELRFLSYEAAAAAPGGVLGAVLRAMDYPDAIHALMPASEAFSNRSPACKPSFTQDDIAEFTARFAPSNAALANRIAHLQPGFSIAPMLAEPKRLFQSDIAADA